MTYSLCMIVKNEEKVLKRCLESAAALFDEIVICDTGSTDKTKTIAAGFTDKIYDFEWCDDFSAARNFAFSKATADYMMWLDADDVITEENLSKLLLLKAQLNTDTDMVMLPYCTAFNESGSPVFSFYRERIVKNNGRFLFKGKVHEAIVPEGNILYADAEIHHKSIKTAYSMRNLLIYEKQLADNEPFSPRDMFYYGRELYYHKRHTECRRVLKDFLRTDGWIENKIEACKTLALSYRETNENELATAALLNTFAYDVPRAEVCCDLGYAFKNKKNYPAAIYWFQAALKAEKKENGGFINKDCHGFIPAIELAVCFDKTGDYVTANAYNELAGTFNPESSSYIANKQYFAGILTHKK